MNIFDHYRQRYEAAKDEENGMRVAYFFSSDVVQFTSSGASTIHMNGS